MEKRAVSLVPVAHVAPMENPGGFPGDALENPLSCPGRDPGGLEKGCVMDARDELLELWFGRADEPGYGALREQWFKKDEAFDAMLRERFEALHRRAAAGELDDWMSSPEGCLALCLLLDQVPRNIYRGRPEAFATDPKARAVAHHAVERGFDQRVLPVQRWFLYLPLEHSERLEDQDLSVQRFEGLPESPGRAVGIDYARRHRDIIARFGRFPHRNAVLGRESSPEEERFLQEPGSSF
jgi:uncharacterized protein (DUF924 family)